MRIIQFAHAAGFVSYKKVLAAGAAAACLGASSAMADPTPVGGMSVPGNHVFVVPTSPQGGALGSFQYTPPSRSYSVGGQVVVPPTSGGETRGMATVTIPLPE